MLALHAVTAPGQALHLTARALNVIGPVLCPAPESVDDSVESAMCSGTVLKANTSKASMLTASKPGDILLYKNPVSLVKACVSESPKSDAFKEVPHRSTSSSSLTLLEKLEEMEEEMKEIHAEMKEKNEKSVNSAFSTLQSSSESASFLHSLCGGDCSHSFQAKIAKAREVSFLREFTGWWIRQASWSEWFRGQQILDQCSMVLVCDRTCHVANAANVNFTVWSLEFTSVTRRASSSRINVSDRIMRWWKKREPCRWSHWATVPPCSLILYFSDMDEQWRAITLDQRDYHLVPFGA